MFYDKTMIVRSQLDPFAEGDYLYKTKYVVTHIEVESQDSLRVLFILSKILRIPFTRTDVSCLFATPNCFCLYEHFRIVCTLSKSLEVKERKVYISHPEGCSRLKI